MTFVYKISHTYFKYVPFLAREDWGFFAMQQVAQCLVVCAKARVIRSFIRACETKAFKNNRQYVNAFIYLPLNDQNKSKNHLFGSSSKAADGSIMLPKKLT